MEETRKEWITPELTVHGSVEAITQVQPCDKTVGGSDGFTFMGVPIVCNDVS